MAPRRCPIALLLTTAAALAVPATAGSPSVTLAATAAVAATAPPQVEVTTLATGLTLPWDLALLPGGDLLFTERPGATKVRRTNGTVSTIVARPTDLFVGSESGHMGITLDPAFASNRTYYTCMAYQGSGTAPIDIRVLRWQLATDHSSAVRVGQPVVTGLPITSGRHGGCRLRFAPDGTLHIGTGDAATGTNAQSLTSLGGKTLRVNKDGTAPADNPFASRGGRAALVWTFGHRNVQGLALRPGTTQMWSAEHGPDRDDEVNLLAKGGNYGWNPVPGYNENVPMTDTVEFPSAVRARWSSGIPTVATSGATFLSGSAWGKWEGALAVAELKNTGVRVLSMAPDGRITADEQLAPLNDTYGRIRTVQSAPDGSIYVTTSNGSDDRILRVRPVPATPQWTPGLDASPSGGVASVLRGSQVTAFVRGTDDRVWYTSQVGAGAPFSAFHPIPGTVASAPAAVTWDGSRVDLFARSAAGHLLHTYNPGNGYRPWEDLGGNLTSAPAAASVSAGTIDIFARTTGDAMARLRWDGHQWTPWTTVGGVLSSAPGASADRAAGTIRVTVRGMDGGAWNTVLTATGARTGFRSLGRQTSSAVGLSQGGSVVMITRNGETPVVVQGSFADALGGQLSGAPAVSARSASSYVVLGRGMDGALYAYDGRATRDRWSKVGGALR
jgi:glucose/arabinose dehydrogenase